ncbi:MAG: serine hydrolase [Fusobacteria bacterium]|nr:serine hydrolase [Fusobacteriota bacterium]
MKNRVGLLVLFLLLCISLTYAQISTGKCSSWILTDSNGNYIAGSAVGKVWPLASLTKLMNAYVVLQNIQEGKTSLSEMTTVNKIAASTSGSSADLSYGQYISVSDLLKGMIIPSGNDAAMTLAYLIGNGSPARFVAQMNSEAARLGMESTIYFTPDGLPTSMTNKPLDVSTASDTAILASKLMASRTFMSICSLGEAKICNGKIMLYSSNPILISVPGTTGMKTGHHNESKYNIVVSTSRAGKKFIVVVFGGTTEVDRNIIAKQIISMAYNDVISYQVLTANQVIKSISLEVGGTNVLATVSRNVNINIIKGTQNKITYRYKLKSNIIGPLKVGKNIGSVSIYYEGHMIQAVNLVSQNTVK